VNIFVTVFEHYRLKPPPPLRPMGKVHAHGMIACGRVTPVTFRERT
jgi:hypothetical protein